MTLKKTIFLFALLLFPLAFSAQAYYNPGEPGGFVNDYAGMLSAEEKSALEAKLTQFEKESGHEIAVAIIPSLQEDTIENFAVKLFEDWKIGKKNQDNGVLILVSLGDRQMRVEVGYGLEGALTDAQASWIINDLMKPAFRQEKYYQGIDAAIDKIIAATRGETLPTENENNVQGGFWNILKKFFEPILFIFIFLLSILARILGKSKSFWLGGVLGVSAGGILGFFFKSFGAGLSLAIFLGAGGLIFDYLVSRKIKPGKESRGGWWWLGGGGRGGSSGGGFGGFGGGGSGGGGASGSW